MRLISIFISSLFAIGLVACGGQAWNDSDKRAADVVAHKAAEGVGSVSYTTVDREAWTTQGAPYARIVISMQGDRDAALDAFARNLVTFGYPMLVVGKDCDDYTQDNGAIASGRCRGFAGDLWVKEREIVWYVQVPSVRAIAEGTPVQISSPEPPSERQGD